ncbi:DUF6503 family protein [Winogradskyella flava]|uniref:Deoxyribose-phosphate aldolase n=1 Tax=Winogradskyella flava TaxID=1884876 RepID=A0A842IRF7_9FLAO|nr:DUF6503 family protein [Winogradskyella flava]MBC2845451.1 deoxyribose-phosphate aldolase [Winogradskyella flava]
MKRIFILLLVISVYSCKKKAKLELLAADDVISKSIEFSGGESFNHSTIQFDFRNMNYAAKRNQGRFVFSRTFEKESESITDFIDNSGFKRMINGEFVKVEDSMAVKYKASVNSVHYFSVLPFGLNDKAVNKALLEEEQIKDKNYFKIKITFDKEGGGEDYEDVFIYWIDKQEFKVVYLAYSYSEEDGIGMRFREAYNERYINGLRFVDYNNYKAKDATITLSDLARAFKNERLKLLSKIELDNITVDLIEK